LAAAGLFRTRQDLMAEVATLRPQERRDPDLSRPQARLARVPGERFRSRIPRPGRAPASCRDIIAPRA
jgi:hypothetical protein